MVRGVFCVIFLMVLGVPVSEAGVGVSLNGAGRITTVAAFRGVALLATGNGKGIIMYDLGSEVATELYRLPVGSVDALYALQGENPMLCLQKGDQFDVYAGRSGAPVGSFSLRASEGAAPSAVVLDADKDGNDDLFVLVGRKLLWVRISGGQIRRTEYALQSAAGLPKPRPVAHPIKREAGCVSGPVVYTAGAEDILDVQVEADSAGPLIMMQKRVNGGTGIDVFRLSLDGTLEPQSHLFSKQEVAGEAVFRLCILPESPPLLFGAELTSPMRAGRLLPRVSMRLMDFGADKSLSPSWSSVYCPTLPGYDPSLPGLLQFPVLDSSLIPGAKEPFLNFVTREELEFRLRFFRPSLSGSSRYIVLPYKILMQGLLSTTITPDLFLHPGKDAANVWLVYRQAPQAYKIVEIKLSHDSLSIGNVSTIPVPAEAEYLGLVGGRLRWLTREGVLYSSVEVLQ